MKGPAAEHLIAISIQSIAGRSISRWTSKDRFLFGLCKKHKNFKLNYVQMYILKCNNDNLFYSNPHRGNCIATMQMRCTDENNINRPVIAIVIVHRIVLSQWSHKYVLTILSSDASPAMDGWVGKMLRRTTTRPECNDGGDEDENDRWSFIWIRFSAYTYTFPILNWMHLPA